MLFDEIREIIADQLDIQPETIEITSALADDLGADSLAIIDIVMSLEDQYSVELPDEVIAHFTTVEDYISYIESHLD